MYSLVTDLPELVQRELKGVGYGRKDIDITASETASAFSSSGRGLRGFCIIIDLSKGDVKHMQGSWGGANMFNPTNQVDLDSKSYVIPENVIVINGSSGDGNPVYARLTVAPSNIAKFLPTKSELTERQATILYTYKGLNSRGRKDYWDRVSFSSGFNGEAIMPKPSEGELDELAGMGLLKRSKSGATQITTDGKNAYESCGIKVRTY
jgi:hypothetical protein